MDWNTADLGSIHVELLAQPSKGRFPPLINRKKSRVLEKSMSWTKSSDWWMGWSETGHTWGRGWSDWPESSDQRVTKEEAEEEEEKDGSLLKGGSGWWRGWSNWPANSYQRVIKEEAEEEDVHEDGTLSKGESDGWRGWSDWPEEEEEDGQEDGSWPEEEKEEDAGGRVVVKRRVRLVEGLVRLARRGGGCARGRLLVKSRVRLVEGLVRLARKQ